DRGLGLALPEVALERAERDDVEAVEPHVAEASLSDVPGEDPLAVAVRRRLREGAGTGNGALADVEPIAGYVPVRDVGHCSLLSIRCREITKCVRTMPPVDEQTLRRMQAVTAETWRREGPHAPLHVGDLAWMRFQHRGREQEWRVRLWQRNGEDVAWAW